MSAPAETPADAPPAPAAGVPEHEDEVQLDSLEQDTDNPLSSNSRFEDIQGIPKEVLSGLAAEGFQKPSNVQKQTLPLMLANDPRRNMIAQSQSGTGKTAAFVTTVLSRISLEEKNVQALVLVPVRELATQIVKVVQQIGQFQEGLQVAAAVPDQTTRNQTIDAHVVAGTPGTVHDKIRRRLLDVSKLKILVVDEADGMLNGQALGNQSIAVKKTLPKDIQILLFSATFPPNIFKYATDFAPNAHQLTLKPQDINVKGISQWFVDCPDETKKYDILVKLYELMIIGSSIIFVKTQESANRIEQRMLSEKHTVTALHGKLTPEERDARVQKFRSGEVKVLVATNVIARGLDVSSVSMVVNYDIPMLPPAETEPDKEIYVHRIGRTGRFGRVGACVTFVANKKDFNVLDMIVKENNYEMLQLPVDDWDETEELVRKVIKSKRAQAAYVPGSEPAA